MSRTEPEQENATLRAEIEALEHRRDELSREGRRYKSLYDLSPDMYASVELEGLTITDCNLRSRDLIGYELEEVVGRPMTDLVPPEDLPRFAKMAEQLVATGSVEGFEHHLLRKDGTYCLISLDANLRYGADGRPVCTRGVGRDIVDQKDAATALRRSEARFRRLAETMRLVPYQTILDPAAPDQLNLKHRPDFVGEQIEPLLGFDRKRWYEAGFWMSRLHDDDRDRVRRLMEQNARKPGKYRTEYRLLAANGEPVWILDVMSVVMAGRGRRMLNGIIIDISASKRDEEVRERLMRELSHRVKNTFATVQALADRTLVATTTLEEFVATFGGRISALAAIHNAMAATEWTGVDLDELVNLALSPFSGAGAVSTHGLRTKIGLDIGRNLGMVLHELATNAVKHGALSSTTGTVVLDWEVRSAGGQRILRVDWVERGGPPVRRPTRRGYGLDLIERAMNYECDGTSNLSFDPEGLRCCIEVSLEEAPA
ncbi:MAG: PAS domain S-box protein [Myxococcales bacterium]|nr:MAG: PAS domain S-box protein [Myxococcales bacterium]